MQQGFQQKHMKPPVSIPTMTKHSPELLRTILDMRRTHSLRQVAELTGLPLGTVKTMCSRSEVFRDNPQYRALFSMPPIRPSTSTDLALLELPPQESVTGDQEVDALLWLRAVIRTGQAALIEKAMTAASRIKTPLADLEKRYTKHLTTTNPGAFAVVFASFGFADLDSLAKRSIAKLARLQEGQARFGDDLFEDTPAELFCIEMLQGLDRGTGWTFNEGEVDQRFGERRDLLPHSLRDCLHELTYWDSLYRLRSATGESGDQHPEVQAREDFVFRNLAIVRAKSKEEAIEVLRFLADAEYMDRAETSKILSNLIG
jgi:hypothetical protein